MDVLIRFRMLLQTDASDLGPMFLCVLAYCCLRMFFCVLAHCRFVALATRPACCYIAIKNVERITPMEFSAVEAKGQMTIEDWTTEPS